MSEKSSRIGLRYAAEGILHCFRGQRHMRMHFLMLALVLISGLMMGLGSWEMLLLLFAISIVITAEMINSAIEAIVDLVAHSYNPAAKIAKDVGAGAVLIASANAIIVGVVIFLSAPPLRSHTGARTTTTPDVTVVLAVGVLILATLVIMTKLVTGRANPELLRGGVVSGHSAIGFFLAMTIVFTSGDRIVGMLALALAALVAQSRVDAGIHTLQQVILGAVLAILFTASVYWLMPYVRSFLIRNAAQRPIARSMQDSAHTMYNIEHRGRYGLRSPT